MPTVTSHSFILDFISSTNRVKTLRVPRARAAATPTQVRDAMQAIIDTGIVVSAAGRPASIYGAAANH